MGSKGGQSVGIKGYPAELGTGELVSTLPVDFDWSEFLDFSQDETASDLLTILAEKDKLPSPEVATQDFERQNHFKKRNGIENSAQQFMSPTSVNPPQAVFEAAKPGDREFDRTAQNSNASTNFTTPDKPNTPSVVKFEELRDPNGVVGLYGLTLEQAQQGMRRPVKKNKQVKPTTTSTLFQPARVQKPRPPVKKPASIQHNDRYAGLSPEDKFLAGLLEEELQRMNSENSLSQPTPGEDNHPKLSNISTKNLQQPSRSFAQKDGHSMDRQSQLKRQQCQTAGKLQLFQQAQSIQQAQSVQQAQHIRQFQSNEQVQPKQQYNALQRQTQSLLPKQNNSQGQYELPRQIGLGYEAVEYKPHLKPAEQSYRKNWSGIQAHAHPQAQHTSPYGHPQGRASMSYNQTPPLTQVTQPQLQRMVSSPPLKQAHNSSHQQVFFETPQNMANVSSQMHAQRHQQSLFGHNSQIPASLPQVGYNFSHPQLQNQPSAKRAAGPAPHGVIHDARVSQQRARRPLTAQQQQWFQLYTQGHA